VIDDGRETAPRAEADARSVRRGDPLARLERLPAGVVYPPSRNPYDRRLAEEFPDLVLRGPDTERYAGRWRSEVFGVGSEARISLELGCGNGHWLTHLAEHHPGELFLGMDWSFKAIYAAASKLKKRGLRNARLLRGNIGRLSRIFGPAEIDRAYILFPDPWPRESRAHKRMVSRNLLQRLARALKPGTRVWFKTDDLPLFRFAREELAALGELYRVTEAIHDLHRSGHEAAGFVTLFERIFINQGLAIKFLEFERLPGAAGSMEEDEADLARVETVWQLEGEVGAR
jgi:tRNA (guanine-N7-)-methyltransferase